MSPTPQMLLGGILALVNLAACASSPPRASADLGVGVPPAWTAAASPSGVIASEWWRQFGDARLDAVVEEALEHSHDLAISAARLDAARARARIAGAGLLPTLGLDFSGSRSRQNFIGLPVPGGNDVLSTRSTSLGVSLNVSWEIDVWGRVRSGQSAALGDVEARNADLHGARLSLAGQTAKLWFAIIEASRQVELARESAASFRLTTAQVRERYERGIRPALDLRLSTSNQASAKALVELWSEQLDRLKRQLESLLGRYPDASLVAAAELPALHEPVPAGLPADLLARRPDLVASERRLAAAGARVDEARAALYPRFSLTTSGGTRSSDLGDLVDLDFSVWTLAGNLAQPIFQGGRLVAGVDLAEANQREALEAFVQNSLNAFGEVESSLAAERYLAERERALQVAVAESAAARRLAEDRYNRGLSEFVTVLEAQRRALDSEVQLITVRRLRLDARIDLYLALGGGFALESPTDAERTEAVSEDGPPT